MAKFKLTNNAVKDLSDIWNYTFDAWSESQADKYYKLILDACFFFGLLMVQIESID